MKIFQILNNICHWDATQKHPTLESTEGKYTPDILFVEAPDYVFEGWGYDAEAEGESRFIKPTPPDGWLYDDATGTFYPEGELPPSQVKTVEQRLSDLEAQQQSTNQAVLGLMDMMNLMTM